MENKNPQVRSFEKPRQSSLVGRHSLETWIGIRIGAVSRPRCHAQIHKNFFTWKILTDIGDIQSSECVDIKDVIHTHRLNESSTGVADSALELIFETHSMTLTFASSQDRNEWFQIFQIYVCDHFDFEAQHQGPVSICSTQDIMNFDQTARVWQPVHLVSTPCFLLAFDDEKSFHTFLAKEASTQPSAKLALLQTHASTVIPLRKISRSDIVSNASEPLVLGISRKSELKVTYILVESPELLQEWKLDLEQSVSMFDKVVSIRRSTAETSTVRPVPQLQQASADSKQQQQPSAAGNAPARSYAAVVASAPTPPAKAAASVNNAARATSMSGGAASMLRQIRQADISGLMEERKGLPGGSADTKARHIRRVTFQLKLEGGMDVVVLQGRWRRPHKCRVVYIRGGLSWQKGAVFPLVSVQRIKRGCRSELAPPAAGSCFEADVVSKDEPVLLALFGRNDETMMLQLDTPADCQLWEDGLSLIVEALQTRTVAALAH